MIRLLDRYVLSVFGTALGVFTAAFVILFVTVDFAMKLRKFLYIPGIEVALFIAEYYLLRLPIMLTFLMPIVVLFASMFTLFRLARTNEILPMNASGVSLRRITLPFLLTALATSAMMAVLEEYVLVNVGKKIGLSEQILESEGIDHSVVNWDGRTKLWAQAFDSVRTELSGAVRVTVSDENMRHQLIVTGKRAVWDTGRRRWIVHDGEIERPNASYSVEGGRPVIPREPIGPEGYVLEADFPPDKLVQGKGRSVYGRLTSPRLKDLLDEVRLRPHDPRAVLKVHARIAFPLSPVILLLLGLPSIISVDQKSFFKGLFFCFLLSIAYYLAFFAFIELGNRTLIPSLVAGWGPTAAFGGFGVAAFFRMRS